MRLPLHAGHRNMPKVFEGRRSRLYDIAARRLLRGVYRRLAVDVADLAPPEGAVLDVGTGPGVLLVEVARRRPDLRLTGVDLSADMVAAANRNLGPFGDRATATVGNVTDLPFPDGSFDLVVSSLSLHHWDHPEAAGPELARVLKPGGRLCVYDFRFAPFDTVTFAGPPPERTTIRTGIPFVPPLVRYVLTSGL